MCERFIEKIEPLFLDSQELIFSLLRLFARVLEFFLGRFEARFDGIETVDGTHIWIELFQLSGYCAYFLLQMFADVLGIRLGMLVVSQILFRNIHIPL